MKYLLWAAVVMALPAYASNDASAERLDTVAERGMHVMPFSLEQTLHIFSKTAMGGSQQVIVKDDNNIAQVRLIREHLVKIAGEFRQSDFSDPAKIHGHTMPGLAELRQAKPGELDVRYSELPNGAQIDYATQSPRLLYALHQWFDAQLRDHARHAIPGHGNHNLHY